MVYKRYIKKKVDGKIKTFGPYYYESYRDKNGIARTKYVNKPERAFISHTTTGKKPFILILIGILALLFVLLFIINNVSDKNVNTLNINLKINNFNEKAMTFYNKMIIPAAKEFSHFITGFVPQGDKEKKETEEEKTKEEKQHENEIKITESKETEQEEKEETVIDEPKKIEEPVINETIPEQNITTFKQNPESNITQNNITEQNITIVNETTSNITSLNETPINITITNESISNITETNITIINETIINITMGNTTIKTIQYGAVLGKPVKWKKQIMTDTPTNISVELPKEAENITVFKIVEEGKHKINESDSINTIIQNEQNNTPVNEQPNITNEQQIKEEIREEVSDDKIKITGEVIKENDFSESIIINFFKKIFNKITGRVIDIQENQEIKEVTINENATEFEIEYETPAPVSYEADISSGKEIIISGPDILHYENVLVFTELPREIPISSINSIKLYHLIEETINITDNQSINDEIVNAPSATGQIISSNFNEITNQITNVVRVPVNFDSYDTNNNSLIDYIEWLVPSLSNQTYQLIIEITKAEHLDSNRTFISDIYNEVKALDGIWSETIKDNEYVRVTFEQELDRTKDITLYARTTNNSETSQIEVYTKDSNELITTFTDINGENWYKVYLTNLNQSQDVFDLKILGNVEFDYIVDPTNTPYITLNAPTNNNITNLSWILLNATVYDLDKDNMTVYIYVSNNSNDVVNNSHSLVYIKTNTANGTEITYNLTSLPVKPGNPNLVLLMHFDNMSEFGENDNNFHDFSGNTNKGSCTNCPLWNSTGKFGGAYKFNANYINISNEPNFDFERTNNFSVCAWINLNSVSGVQAIVSKLENDAAQTLSGWELNTNTGGNGLYFALINNYSSSNQIDIYVNNVLSVNKWYHVCATYDGSSSSSGMNLYLNGTLLNPTFEGSITASALNNKPVMIGARDISNPSYYINGLVDDVAIWNRTLSASEIQSLYSLGGKYYWVVNASDGTLSNLSETRNFTLDTSPPSISIITPLNNTITIYNNVNVNYTASDSLTNVSSCWYSNDTMTLNISLTSSCNNITTITWSQGQHNVTIWANDSFNSINSASVRFTISTSSLLISIALPNNTFSSNTNLNVNYSVYGGDINFCWYSNDTMTLNISLTASCNNITTVTWAEGQHNVTIWANNSANNVSLTSVRFTIDTIYPGINFTAPTPANATTQSATWVYVNVTTSDTNNHSAFIDWNRSLVGWWNFENINSSSGVVYDNSSWENNGNITNHATNTTVFGARGKALQFDGVDDYIEISNSASLNMVNGTNITIAFWANLTQLSGRDEVLICKPWFSGSFSSPWYQYGVEFTSSNQLNFYLGFTTGEFYPWSMTPSMGTWTYVVFTYDGANVRGYLNGVQDFASSETRKIQARGNRLRIGVDEAGSQEFNSTIDEIMIFNRVLTPAEINASYNAGVYSLYNNFTSLASGTYTYKAYVIDVAGNINQTEQRTVTIDTTSPYNIILNAPANNSVQTNPINFNWTAYDAISTSLTCNLTIDSIVNASNILSNNGTATNKTVTGFTSGSHLWNVTCWDNATNANTSATRTFTINLNTPYMTLNTPTNNTFTNLNWNILNTTVVDADADNMTVYIYANNNSNGLNASEGLVYKGLNIANNTQIIYNLTALPIKPGDLNLVLLYHFDNMSEFGESYNNSNGSIIYDFSSAGSNGTLYTGANGDTVYNVSGGKFAGAFQFDGVNDRIYKNITADGKNWSGNFTVSVWVKAAKTGQGEYTGIFSSSDSSAANTFQIDIQSGCGYSVRVNDNSGAGGYSICFDTTYDTNWHHLVLVRNSSSALLTYQDGVFKNPLNLANIGFNGLFNVYKIGVNRGNNAFFNGTIDEVAVWNRTLTASEILNLYRLGEGKYYWNVNASDGTLSNLSETREFTIDTTLPTITLNSPANNSVQVNPINFNWTASDNLATTLTCNLTIDSVVNASNILSDNGTPTNKTITGFSEIGSHLWNVTCWDNATNTNTSVTNIFNILEAIAPSNVSLNSPLNNANLSNKQVTFNCTANDNSNLANISLWGNWSSDGWHSESTDATSGTSATTIFKVNISYGTFIWNCLATDISNNKNWSSANYTFNINNLTSRKLTYTLASQLTSGIEINDTTWELAGGSTDFNARTIGRKSNSVYDAGFVFNLSNVNKYDYFIFVRLVLTSINSSLASGLNLTISGAATDSVSNFTSGFRPSNYNKTTTQINWFINQTWAAKETSGITLYFDYYTPNIASIINEIISRPNWNESSKTIAIFIDDNSSVNENNSVNIVFNNQRTKLEMSEMTKNTVQNAEFITAVSHNSSLLSMFFTDNVDFYVEYGNTSGVYTQNSTILTNQLAYEPVEVSLTNLTASTKYFYRVRVRDNRTNRDYEALNEHNFTTRRNAGESFVFTHITDTHLIKRILLSDSSSVNKTEVIMNRMAADNPDFVMDTGDTAMTHILVGSAPAAASQKSADWRYQITRNYFENMSLPIYYSLGNHEGELGFEIGKHTFSLSNWSRDARLKYWAAPTNTTYPQGGGEYENYYAFEWGDALFIILDSYRYQNFIPVTGNDWILGTEQLNWLNTTLNNSDKKWKFIFTHHIIGGADSTLEYNYGDGGGNYSQTGNQKIINDLMEEFNAQAFFYGHIHNFAHDWNNWSSAGRINSINYIATTSGGEPACSPDRTSLYDYDICENGYTKVEVSPYNVTFHFVNWSDGNYLYSYTINNTKPSITLISPSNSSLTTNSSVNFVFNYTDSEYDRGKNCTLFLDDVRNKTQFGVISGAGTTFSVSSLLTGTHNWYVNCSDGALSNVSEIRVFTVSNDTTPPVVILISPANAYSSTDTSVTYQYNITDASSTNCSLILDGSIINFNSSVNISGGANTFINTTSVASHTWNINCTDSLSNTANSSSRTFTITSAPSSSSTSSGGGGGGGIVTPIIKNFEVDKEQISVKLKQGETFQIEFTLSNKGTTSLDLSINSSLEDMMKIEDSFNLAGGESKKIKIDIIARENTIPNIYLGKIFVSSGSTIKEILVSVEVVSKESLFDVVLEIPKKYQSILPGEDISFKISLTRMIESDRKDVVINYTIKDENGNVIISSEDTKAIETSMSFIKELKIPEETKYGKYVLYVQVIYEGKIASASDWFSVVAEKKSNMIWWVLLGFLIIFIITITIILIVYFRRKNIEK